ncbi:unnamed protein product [Coregonus sp. 'balchen']|nr:unnamed protein product [Coregonus sp. 'balchen']
MPAGNIPRTISDGLVEISWYLPSGNPRIDVFTEPVAVANLRGDIQDFQTQFSFLCETSAAVFVFCDVLGSDSSILNLQKMKDRLVIVCNSEAKSYDAATFEKHSGVIIRKDREINNAQLVKKLRSAVTDVMKANPHKTKVEKMCVVAHELGIPVDEYYDICLKAKKSAALITDKISCIPSYKKSKLRLQGEIWKSLTALEKEEVKLKKVGDKDIEMYKSELKQEKYELRKKQLSLGVSDSMQHFVEGLRTSKEERSYFLKWMKLNLDNLSRTRLSTLREKYKNLCQITPDKKDLIADLDKQISNSSLGTEHFLREVGQIYEATMSSESSETQQKVQGLPIISAELMLEGFPLELMDGDASNIPMKWISDVLQELHVFTMPNNKIRVVSVLGVQSSGKSTLLNTMFGVQFAFSSGRCTRGAFMQLIKVEEEFRDELKCDFIMVIDTEGLKGLQSTHLTGNYQHDNELATLLVGLSDISIVNIAMENTTDMKDTMQIVAHAFLRMKELGKKPSCQFVHQNVADISSHDKNLWDRKHLLEQLNEMTIVASRMENTGGDIKFTDIIDCSLEDTCYIPGLWHGSPPMAPVNEGYSEAVANFKKKLINAFKKEEASNVQTIPELQHEIICLWTSIKYEIFIFSFRNSIVAEAYTKLCVEFDRWERAFQKHMYTWLIKAETMVANYGIKVSQQESGLDDLLNRMKSEARDELDREGKKILNNIHICGHAAREFQKMHNAFIKDNDPRQSLEKLKPQYFTDFKDLFYKRDHCKRKAEEFTKHCLEPAVKEYIIKSLGPDILEEMLSNCVEYLSKRSREDKGISIITNMEVQHLKTISRQIKKAVEKSLQTGSDRPDEDDGLGGYKWSESDKLSTDTCSCLIINNKNQFRSVETKGKFCSYKKYQKFFTDWIIQPNPTQTVADYWKFLFVKYNKEYAGFHGALPADLPGDWSSITMKQAKDSLEENI